MTTPISGKVLVTGADGFIGSHLVETLVRRGHDVRALALYSSFNSWGWLDKCADDVKGQFEVVTGDVRDPHGVRNMMRGCGCVFHLAALIAIPYSYHSPATYVDTNVSGTLNVVQAARELDVTRVLHTSTSEVYGSARYVPIDEEHPLQGQSPYSASKIGADQIALSYFRSFETPVTVVRPFNTYGPRQSARAVIPTVITQVAAGVDEIKLGSLSPTRDFSHVADTVAGFIALAECDEALGDVVNLGSGFEISIGDTVNLITKLMNRNVTILSDEDRVRPEKSEVNRLFSDMSKARSISEWRPKYGGMDGFERGVAETIEWFTSPGNLENYKHDIYNI